MNTRTQMMNSGTHKIQPQKSNLDQKIHNNQISKWQPLPTHQTHHLIHGHIS